MQIFSCLPLVGKTNELKNLWIKTVIWVKKNYSVFRLFQPFFNSKYKYRNAFLIFFVNKIISLIIYELK